MVDAPVAPACRTVRAIDEPRYSRTADWNQLPTNLWSDICMHLSPRCLNVMHGVHSEISRELRRPTFLAAYVRQAAPRCPLTVDVKQLEHPTQLRAALGTLRSAEVLGSPASWNAVELSCRARHESPFGDRYENGAHYRDDRGVWESSAALTWGGGTFIIVNRHGADSRDEIFAGDGALQSMRLSSHIMTWVGHAHVPEGELEDPALLGIPDGWKATLSTLDGRGLLAVTYLPSQVRLYALRQDRCLPELMRSLTMRAGERIPLVWDAAVHGVLEQTADGAVRLYAAGG